MLPCRDGDPMDPAMCGWDEDAAPRDVDDDDMGGWSTDPAGDEFEYSRDCACPACVEYFAAVPVALDEEPTVETPAVTMRELVELTR